MWVNPAGLGGRPIASAFGEAFTTRSADGRLRVGQYSFALSSRNAAVGYRRDRFEGQPSQGSWRVGGGFGVTHLVFGTSVEFHKGGRAWDAGVQFLPYPALAFGVVLRNIGRPVVRDSALRLTSAGSVSWSPAPRALIAAEAIATERRPVAAGYDGRYRVGGQYMFPSRSPITVMSLFDFESGVGGIRLAGWSVGLAFGGAHQLRGVASVLEPAGASRRLEGFSMAGLARAVIR